ncbi:MAG: capsule assembly Wzi family protein [Alcanivorax sp.]|nr:capsule assembly Wzi family protein [Alcanivorax sp.]
MLTRLISLTMAAALALTTLPAHSRPWIEPGDIRARHSLQWLADRGCIAAPITSWPVMWADVSPALGNDAPEYCRNSMAWRYLRFERDYHASGNARVSLRAAGASREPLFRDFGGGAREKAEIGARLEVMSGDVAIGIAPSYARDPRDGDRLRLDGSYLAGNLGNWVLGAGAIDRWWGPGWHSSAILSDNARPVPGVWVNRRRSTAPEHSWLRWIGPWNLVLFAGQLESERAIEDAKLLGARLTVRPIQALEIGFVRTAQWGGEGRRQSFRSLGECAIGKSNGETDGFAVGDDPCNQLAGVDFRLGVPVAETTMGFYGQVIGEDEAGYLPAKLFGLLGVDLGTRLGGTEQRFYAEFTDTQAGTFSSEKRANVAFEHTTYQTGYRFNGRNIASTWESDARVVTLGVSQFFRDGSDISVTLSRAELNRDGTLRGRPPEAGTPLLDPVGAQEVDIYALSYRRPVLGGRLTLSGYRTSKEIDSVARLWPRGTVMAAWEFRFD